MIEPQTLPGVFKVLCDADRAGDLGTRSMTIWNGSHVEKASDQAWDAVQSTIALNSGESEYKALLRSSTHAFGTKAMLNDWRYGVKCEIHMCCDSSAARACLLNKDWEHSTCWRTFLVATTSSAGRTCESAQCPDK